MTLTARGRFCVHKLTQAHYGPTIVELGALHPWIGEIRLEISGPLTAEDREAVPAGARPAVELFQPGSEFYVDFVPVPKPEPAA